MGFSSKQLPDSERAHKRVDLSGDESKSTSDSGRRNVKRWLFLLVTLMLIWLLAKYYPHTPPQAPGPHDGQIIAAILVGLTLLGVVLSIIRLKVSGRATWEPLKTDEIRWGACLDTVLIAVAYVFIAVYTKWPLFMMSMALVGSGSIIIAHLPAGLHIALRELLAFYGTVSMWGVVTFRVPHKRLHPDSRCECHGPWDEESVDIRSIGDVVAVIFGNILLFPRILSTVFIKASSLLLFPLIYIALSFDARDYLNLSLEARRRWRSSFKSVWIATACFSLFLFAAKMIVYGQWNNIASYWNSSSLCVWIDRPLAPQSFYVGHLTIALNAVVVLIVTFLVDRAVYHLDDCHTAPAEMPRRLRAIRLLFRVRTVLSVYNWVCFMLLVFPLFRGPLPGITWVVFPR